MSILNFHHIQKTAGTTITKSLINFFHYNEYKESGPFIRNHIKSDLIKYGNQDLVNDHINKICKNIKFFSGHGNMLNFNLDLINFTFFRNPVNVIYSKYNQIRQTSSYDYSYAPTNSKLFDDAKKMAFEDFILLNKPRFWNPQVRSFCLPVELDSSERKKFSRQDNETAKMVLSRAKKQIENMLFVGLAEYANEDINRIFNLLGFPQPNKIQSHNVRATKAQHDAAIKEIPDDYYMYDIELYEHAKSVRKDITNKKNSSFFTAPFHSNPRVLDVSDKSCIYRMSEPLFGVGWQDRYKQDEITCVWMGPDTESSLNLRIKKAGYYDVYINIAGAQDSKQLYNAKIFINDVQYDYTILHTTEFPFSHVKIHCFLEVSFKITIKIPFTVCPQKKLGVTDYRDLGLAISSITVSPSGMKVLSQKHKLLRYAYAFKSKIAQYVKKLLNHDYVV